MAWFSAAFRPITRIANHEVFPWRGDPSKNNSLAIVVGELRTRTGRRIAWEVIPRYNIGNACPFSPGDEKLYRRCHYQVSLTREPFAQRPSWMPEPPSLPDGSIPPGTPYAADARGWPFPALYCHFADAATPAGSARCRVTGGVRVSGDTTLTCRALPLLPIWPGAAANTALYSSVFGLIWFLPSGVRRAIRRRRGRCTACGYDLRGLRSGACPECGKVRYVRPPARRVTRACHPDEP